ncbi:hypothetical protein MycrhDRAFT_6489 [Mycolicibacterium rhodesiae JS60]|nr:hypothetical protein MycrhDRAFT_6489 [Mycolicibacterium rhodesiae JS60]
MEVPHARPTSNSRRPRRTDAQVTAEPVPLHELHIVTVSVADAVQWIGGWLTDRALAGWEVSVFAPESVDPTTLRILGASHRPLSEIAFTTDVDRIQPVVSVDAAIACAEPDLWDELCRRYAPQASRILFWGQLPDVAVDADIVPTDYRMSSAANAFKMHALWSLGLVGPPAITERFYRLSVPGRRAAQPA